MFTSAVYPVAGSRLLGFALSDSAGALRQGIR